MSQTFGYNIHIYIYIFEPQSRLSSRRCWCAVSLLMARSTRMRAVDVPCREFPECPEAVVRRLITGEPYRLHPFSRVPSSYLFRILYFPAIPRRIFTGNAPNPLPRIYSVRKYVYYYITRGGVVPVILLVVKQICEALNRRLELIA